MFSDFRKNPSKSARPLKTSVNSPISLPRQHAGKTKTIEKAVYEVSARLQKEAGHHCSDPFLMNQGTHMERRKSYLTRFGS